MGSAAGAMGAGGRKAFRDFSYSPERQGNGAKQVLLQYQGAGRPKRRARHTQLSEKLMTAAEGNRGDGKKGTNFQFSPGDASRSGNLAGLGRGREQVLPVFFFDFHN